MAPTGEPVRRRRMPRAERERQMIHTAEAVFAERGYLAASMDDIAARVGVSKPMLYEYFTSKEGLLLACIRASRAELRQVTEDAVAGVSEPQEALRRGLLAFFVYIRERRQAWSLLRHEMTLLGTSAAAEEVEATRRQQTELLRALTAGFLATDVPTEAVAELVVGATDRLAIWCERHDGVTPEQATDYAMTVLWAGLGSLRPATRSHPTTRAGANPYG